MKCRHCGTPVEHTFVDLGFAPPSNAYLEAEDLCNPEVHYPLRVKVCHQCWLVQTEDYARAEELFSADYAYFSSTSSSWLDHAAEYVAMITRRLQLGPENFVIEVASNDGYLLKNFVAAGIPCLGIEPTAGTAAAAEALGIPVRREFFGGTFGRQLADEGRHADLIVGNNVYAHVPDINDFTRGLATVLKPKGVVTLEFPHLMPMIEQTQFDTVYHEHFSYLSLTTVARIFATAGIRVWDVEELQTHGGSLRVYGCHVEAPIATTDRVGALLLREDQFGMTQLETYTEFQKRADRVKDDLLAFLIEQKRAGRRVAAYGAAAKGNTLLNYAGVLPDLLPYVCDAAASKQGKFMPGSHIPITSPAALRENPPDYVLILPWNIAREVRTQLADLVRSGTRFVTAVPKLSVQ
ncbi:class I SAM-dependent methyltransferase [Mycobacterium paraseoulense]|uniref:SAM-dependent methyltransferase n=1 Tax=Mycobacterium paraseoulense TaxID=590652 RepID=A0A1X0I8B8_9MYCO|nr:class I SAM-dependent methyltransferase [Mycobacterium paraseoulense]MCV7396940.1 class I SAM-dependent methyltransferase [Mycobacterium paraseoulense]ORB37222.1 SAM-dependent methyltransferase [Mycobacterium paraseoulense]BBZ69192.1 SAM-dependent methyltransferase [Mycobacterium paraseoulense]